jgi:hypothetical protein
MSWFSKKEDTGESSHEQSSYDKALEDEYYFKYNAMIYDDLSDEDWNKCNERLTEIKEERGK